MDLRTLKGCLPSALGIVQTTVISLIFLAGCTLRDSLSGTPPAPFITREERARMPQHERDDPYTIQHMQGAARAGHQ